MYVVIFPMVIFLRSIISFLNHEDISSVLHLGFINEAELEFQKLFKKRS